MTTETKKKPFGFEVSYELYNARGERLRNVLLRENPGSGQALQLDIVNMLEGETITLNTLQNASADDFHFRLYFALGAAANREVAVEGADWDVARVANAQGVNMYLAWRSPSVTLAPGERLVIVLHGVSAGPQAGAEVTMQIAWPEPDTAESSTRALVIHGPGEGDYEREGNLVLGVRDRRGRPDIPLRAYFVGPNQVMNADNVGSMVVLRLFNSAPKGSQETLHFRNSNGTRLVVSLPFGEANERPWALGTRDQLNGVKVWHPSNFAVTGPRESADGNALEWELFVVSSMALAPGEHMDLALVDVVTAHPSGIANLELQYRAVPGYWDGEIVCAIEKAPLVFGRDTDDFKNQANVGIGNSQPDARLYLRKGHLRLDDAEVQSEGPLVFRSDANSSGDSTAVRFLKMAEGTAMLELLSSGELVLGGGELKLYSHGLDGKAYIRAGEDGSGTDIELQLCTQKGGIVVDAMLLTKEGRVRDKTGFLAPVGTIVAYGGSTAPDGWLLCDGRSVPQTAYADLFAVIRTTYGSALLPTQFKLPDLRKRVPVGAQSATDATYKPGLSGGADTVTLTTAQMPSHNHVLTDPGHTHAFDISDGGRNVNRAFVGGINRLGITSVEKEGTGISLASAGGDQPHENMPPYLVINYIIKY